MKNIVISAAIICCIASVLNLVSVYYLKAYWKHRAISAEAVIYSVEQDNPDYVLDVLCEGDAWQTWEESK